MSSDVTRLDTPTPAGRRSRRRWSPAMVVGCSLATLLVLIAILAPIFMSGAAEGLTAHAGLSPRAGHWFGTDDFGRDVFARSLVATRLTLLMTAAVTVISVGAGLVIGMSIRLAPSRIREPALRLLETTVAYPGLIFALVIAAILQPGVGSAIVAIGVAGIPGFARIVANLSAPLSQAEYIVTARLLGVSRTKVALRHLLPNIAEPILTLTSTTFAMAMMELSALSFIGLGVQSPQFDYGRLLTDGLDALYTQPMQALGPAIMIIVTGLAALLIGDALAALANPYNAAGPVRRVFASNPVVTPPSGDEALVRVENLRISIPDGAELVHGVTFEIRPGEVLGLVGESGSGKSLTAMTVAGLPAESLEVSADALRVGDLNMLARAPRDRLAKDIAVIYQDPGTTFNPALRMGSQLTEVLRTHLGVSRQDARRRMVDALASVNVSQPATRLRQHPHELSGGMRQRAMIASAMVTDPRLLVADEPTTALDVTVQAEVLRHFRRLHKGRDSAILFISHDLGVVQELCDTVLVMKDGAIVEELTQAQLASGLVEHPYTRKLLSAVPVIDTAPAPTPTPEPVLEEESGR